MLNISYKNWDKLFCDKFSVTLNLNAQERIHFLQRLALLDNHGYCRKVYRSFYQSSYQFFPFDNLPCPILIQHSPFDPSYAFVRFEYNPSKVSPVHIRDFMDFVLPQKYDCLVKNGMVTRLDLAIDLRVHIDDILVWKPGVSKTSLYSKSKRTTSYTLGSKTSPKQICCYDKYEQIRYQNSKSTLKQALPQLPTTRIEGRFQNRYPFQKLHEIDNLFAGLKVFDLNRIEIQDEKFWLFTQACHGNGTHKVFKGLSDKTQKEYKAILSAAQAKWWRPDYLWQQWPKLCETLLYPDKNTISLDSILNAA